MIYNNKHNNNIILIKIITNISNDACTPISKNKYTHTHTHTQTHTHTHIHIILIKIITNISNYACTPTSTKNTQTHTRALKYT